MSKKPSVAVIGAGLGGLAAGIKLKEEGFDDVTILEKAAKVANFPNMFVLCGPNRNLGHNSITFMLERQVEYTVKALTELHARGGAAMDVTESAQTRFNKALQADLAKPTWADPHCRSWYKNEHGDITQNWSSHTRDYANATERVEWGDYAVRPRQPLAAE
jgi:cation diffusion facilitator CzcD-associated flavoprotein CzcO